MSLDVLYLTWNRLEFTRASLRTLLDNTDWDRVDRLIAYDDGSTDGTAEHVIETLGAFTGVRSDVRLRRFGSPVDVMRDYLTHAPAAYVAKVDNDIAVPPGWLPRMEAAFVGVDALGMAAGWTGVTDGPPGVQRATHIGGVGVIRTDRVNADELYGRGRYGWTEYQQSQVRFRSGWVTPDVQAVQLDLIPDEPWRTLAHRYVERGWARWWPPYDAANRAWWDWIPAPETA